MVPPMIPPRPKGSTTLRIMPHLVAPRAKAPSRSPTGAWVNTSRMMELAIGATIRATTIPAMKVEAVKIVGLASGSSGSKASTAKIGIQPK